MQPGSNHHIRNDLSQYSLAMIIVCYFFVTELKIVLTKLHKIIESSEYILESLSKPAVRKFK